MEIEIIFNTKLLENINNILLPLPDVVAGSSSPSSSLSLNIYIVEWKPSNQQPTFIDIERSAGFYVHWQLT